MSRDYAIVKIRGAFRPVSEVADDDYISLGGLKAVQKAIRTAFPSAEWSNPTWAVYSGKDANGKEFEIEIDLDGVKDANAITTTVHGPGNEIPALLKLTEVNGWLAVDASGGEFIDPNNPLMRQNKNPQKQKHTPVEVKIRMPYDEFRKLPLEVQSKLIYWMPPGETREHLALDITEDEEKEEPPHG
jgi:hypothetical protein